MAWTNRGIAYCVLGQPQKGLADFNKAIDLDPKLVYAWYNRGLLCMDELHRYDQALADFTQATDVNPKYAPAWNGAAWLLAECPNPKFRDPSRAVELAGKAVALAPNRGSFQYTLGVAHFRAGNWKEAVAALQKSMELGKGGDSSDWFFLAMARWKLGQKEEARTWYEKAVAWMAEHRPEDDGLRRIRTEAAQVLGVPEKRD
jgi:tetratricopeptide (TPR) repeat protein